MRRYVKYLPADISSNVTALSGELAAIPDKNILENKLIDAFGNEFGVRFIEESESSYEASLA